MMIDNFYGQIQIRYTKICRKIFHFQMKKIRWFYFNSMLLFCPSFFI